MSVAKLSVSMDGELARLIRSVASEEGVSVSTWLSEAALARTRQRALRKSVTDQARRYGPISLAEARRGAAATRTRSRWIGPKRSRK